MEPAESSATAAPRSQPPRFVTGSLLRHILVMTGTGAVGLVAIFIGDLANILFLSWLGDEAVVAAVGYASSILFFTTSIGIGLSIAATSLVSPAVGAHRRTDARRLASSALMLTLAASTVLTVVVWAAVSPLLSLLGAAGRTQELARDYLWILVPFLPPLALAMTSTGILRSVGDARRAMHVTLTGAIVNVVLDPFFIFGLGLGIHGAAAASAIARLAMLAYALHAVVRVHDMAERPSVEAMRQDWPPLMRVAVPAVLTNIATPVGNAYVTAAIALHGDSAVAAWAIIGRIIPVAFGAIYALSGSIGPIIGQNYGAGEMDRMRGAFTLSLAVNGAFTLAAWIALSLGTGLIIDFFRVTGGAEDLISLFNTVLSPLFVFLGALFVANAAFNTLGRAHLSTWLNWGRATIGTIPFVEFGSRQAGAEGVLVGNMVGAIAFGSLAVWMCYRLLDDIRADAVK
jgi:putative MATE family efflux protein